MSANLQSVLRKHDVVTILVPGKAKMQVEFETNIGPDWQLRLSPAATKILEGQRQITVNYVRNGFLHTGVSEVLTFDRELGVCIISGPGSLQSRPIRRWPRVPTELSTAIVVMSKEGEEAGFLYRKENRILNISQDGALIVCRTELDKNKPILLLTCLDPYRPYQRDDQFYMQGVIVRQCAISPVKELPYAYGIHFTNMFPVVKGKLQEYVGKGAKK